MAKLAAGQKASQARRRAMLGSPPALTPSKSAPESLSTQRASIANMTKLSRTRAATPADVSDGYEVNSNIEEHTWAYRYRYYIDIGFISI
jgi:hypothetical protein